jgi:hypothetical protein
VHPIVQQIIDRDCHVSMSNQEVVRHVISKLRDGYNTFRAMRKHERRRLIEDCILRHRANWLLYAWVMNGASADGHRRRNSKEAGPRSLSGAELGELMRTHGVTIAGLAFRLGTTERRVRHVRQYGLGNLLAVRDWMGAVCGGDPGPLPEKYRISHRSEEAECGFCGYPMFVDDEAFEFEGDVFCSTYCCRKSRGWS